MSLLGGSKTQCYVCGKDVDPEDAIEKYGHTFGCEECVEQFEDEEKPDETEICEFC